MDFSGHLIRFARDGISRRLGVVTVAVALALAAVAPPGVAAPETSSQLTPAPDRSGEPVRRAACPSLGCEWRVLPFYAYGTIPIPDWNRCIIWELRARVDYRIDPNAFYAGPAWHVYDGLNLNRTRMNFKVRRYCETSGDNPSRLLGGLHARPSIHMTDQGAGRCSLNPAVGFSFPWSVGVSISPSCERAKVARRDNSVVWSKTDDLYSVSEAEPTRTQLRYPGFETFVDRSDRSYGYRNVVCFRIGMSGSAEAPRVARAKSFSKSVVRCVNLFDGRRP